MDKLFNALKQSLEFDDIACWEWDIEDDQIVNFNQAWLSLYEMSSESISSQFDARFLDTEKEEVWSNIREGLTTDQGSCLGLAICKGIMDKFGGTILLTPN